MERSMTVSDDHLALSRFPRLCVSWNITFTNDDEQGNVTINKKNPKPNSPLLIIICKGYIPTDTQTWKP
jgi:hypothetical protein